MILVTSSHYTQHTLFIVGVRKTKLPSSVGWCKTGSTPSRCFKTYAPHPFIAPAEAVTSETVSTKFKQLNSAYRLTAAPLYYTGSFMHIANNPF